MIRTTLPGGSDIPPMPEGATSAQHHHPSPAAHPVLGAMPPSDEAEPTRPTETPEPGRPPGAPEPEDDLP